MTVAVPPNKYDDATKQVAFYDRLKERVDSLPGVGGSGTVSVLPLQGGNTTRFYVDGDPVPPPGQEIEANMRIVSESYFQTLGVPLIAGRMFDNRDVATAPPPTPQSANAPAANTRALNSQASNAQPPTQGVVIIGKTLADKIFAGRDPVGRKLAYTSAGATPDLIVGVVGDVKSATR